MLIPLGILAASGAAAGSYELIETITVGSGGAASVTFSNLNTYSPTYQHLQIRLVARDTRSLASSNMNLRFNGDTAGNYAWHNLYGDGGGVGSSAGTSSAQIRLGDIPAANATAGHFAPMVIDILDPYETTKNKTTRAFSGMTVNYNWVDLGSGHWRNTAAVTSITLASGFANFVQGSRFSIYGLKAS